MGAEPQVDSLDHLLHVKESDSYKCDIATQDAKEISGDKGLGMRGKKLLPS